MLMKGLTGEICLLLSIFLFSHQVFYPLIWIMEGYYEREFSEKDACFVDCVCL